MLKGRQVSPIEFIELASKSLHFVGYQGMSTIAVSGLDMAAWDALQKGGRYAAMRLFWAAPVGSVRAYNSNGLWLKEPEAVAAEAIELREEGGFMGPQAAAWPRAHPCYDLSTLKAVRNAVGDDIHLMVDFNQGLHLGEALKRCHLIDDFGLEWIEEPIVYDNFDGYKPSLPPN